MKTATLNIERIDVPDDVERSADRVQDDLLRKSIEQGGIQQPIVVVPGEGGRYLLVDGLRRLRAARTLGLGKVPAVIDDVPKDLTADEYRRRLRFILDEHRQDLLPSQKAELIETLKRMFSMNHKQVSAYLGVDQDSVTNWLAVKHYIEPVRQALDHGKLTMQAARAFDGLTESGQEKIWQKHGSDLMEGSGGRRHKEIRAQYPPDKHPEMYRDPKMVAERLARVSGKRKAKVRAAIPADEKKKLMSSLETKETELRDGQQELKELKAEINAATPIVAAITRNEKLLSQVPKEMKEELERFAEIYV